MQKGKELETQINKLINYINANGYHAHKNNPCRTQSGKYIAGEPFDFEIFTDTYHCVFDAKECHDTVWRLKPKDIKQAENLKHCKNAGIDAFFLIYFFPLRKLLKIDVDKVIEILKSGVKSVPSKYGEQWEFISHLH